MPGRAIYPGSFDPPTLGHLDIVERAATIFDELVVAVGVNSEKGRFLSSEERVESLRECTGHLANVRVRAFDGLLVEFARAERAKILVRGLRAVSDYEYEFRVGMANRRLAPEIETLFLIARDEYSFLASSVVREVARLGGDYAGFVPEPVARRIKDRLGA
ncbi:MAG: pantetheine-phosphate adenylyltransferase [Fimbriimonadaceae bacterium]|nr:pantetheine-phosphate adenylyltransferase [Fimbriimonadaceae bacterium]QYK56610.1 MAG: pantetheine-phosphate adenylyltransferase [Fimbriimonadaceae bacterium]